MSVSPIGTGRFTPTSAPDEAPEGAAPSGTEFAGFPGIKVSGMWIDEQDGKWMAGNGPRRTGTLVIHDRGGGVEGAIGNLLSELYMGHSGPNEGVVESLVAALGKDKAKDMGLRESRTIGNLFGAAGGHDFRIPVEVDTRLKPRDYGSLPRDATMYFPLPKEIGDALKASGSPGIDYSANGVRLSTDDKDGRVYLSVAKYNVMNANGLF